MGFPYLRLMFILFFAACTVDSVHAAGGFQKSDCACSLSGISAGTQSAGSTELQCTWIKSSGSSKSPAQLIAAVKKMPDKQTALQVMQETNAFNRQSIGGQRGSRGFSCVEEYYGDTKSSVICGDTSFMGGRSIIYRDVYAIAVSGGGFGGQELKGYLDKLEPCMKAAVDSHAGGKPGTSSTVKVTTTSTKRPYPTYFVPPGLPERAPWGGLVDYTETYLQYLDLTDVPLGETLRPGLTRFGVTLTNQLANTLADIIGVKPVPIEVEEALSDAGIDCDESDPETRDDCFRNAALMSGNPLICIKMRQDYTELKKCYYEVAMKSGNPELCEQAPFITGSFLVLVRTECYDRLYRTIKDPTFCQQLPEYRRIQCNKEMAYYNKDFSYCSNIPEAYDRSNCMTCVAVETNNPESCNVIGDQISRENCISRIQKGGGCRPQRELNRGDAQANAAAIGARA